MNWNMKENELKSTFGKEFMQYDQNTLLVIFETYYFFNKLNLIFLKLIFLL